MAVICDTSGIYALYDRDDKWHVAARELIEQQREDLWLPVVLLAEIDYLLSARLGQDASTDFLESVQMGAFQLVSPTEEAIKRCLELMRDYRDLQIGIADASVVAAAEIRQDFRVFTTDERHFRVIRPRGAEHFVLLPADRHE